MPARSQFEDGTNGMAFRNETLLDSCKIFQRRWIMLAQCNIDEICCREFGNILFANGRMAESTEISEAIVVAALI